MDSTSPEVQEIAQEQTGRKKRKFHYGRATVAKRLEEKKLNERLPTKRQLETIMSVQAIRELLENEGRKIVASAPAARELIHKTITKANAVLDREDEEITDDNYRRVESTRSNDYRLASIATESAKLVLQTSGLLPTNMSSVVVNNVLVSSETVLAPMIAKVLGESMRKSQPVEEIDITPDPFEQTYEEP